MNRKIKRIFSIILVACVLLTLVQPHATFWAEEDVLTSELITEDESSTDSNANIESGVNSYFYLSSEDEEKNAEQEILLTSLDDETEEPENDNWELGLVFYDSSVDNGKTPLTEIDWDASNGGYGEGEARVITVQINYKNTNAVTNYQPGELEISIPNLVYLSQDDKLDWNTSIIIGANDSTHIGYDWNYSSGESPSNDQEIFSFTNNYLIEEKTNFEGNIQIVYTITPTADTPEPYEDECYNNFNKNLKAVLNNIESNEIYFAYNRTYIHPWKKASYTVTKKASTISSYDGLGKNASDYIWVKYTFNYGGDFTTRSNYPIIYANYGRFKDKLPDECIVYDRYSNLMKPDEEGYYETSILAQAGQQYYIFVGYPKSIYNEENGNLLIINEVELWGRYNNANKYEKLATNSININLSDYNFSYSGNLYGIEKTAYGGSSYKLYYQEIVNNRSNNTTIWNLSPTAIYTGTPMTIKIGDDLLFATSQDGDTVKLNDDEYNFSQITWTPSAFKNGNGTVIQSNKYDCELWIRQKNSNEYILYDSFKNPGSTKNWYPSNVVGFYFIVNDMTESLANTKDTYLGSWLIVARTKFFKKDIPKTGNLHNFDYIQVFFKDSEGNLLLQNAQTLDNYASFITKEDIATYDLETYGVYLQRDTRKEQWTYYNVTQFRSALGASKKFNSIIQNKKDERFEGACNVGAAFRQATGTTFELKYVDQYDKEYAIQGFKIFDLLPEGMELTSTEEEIINSLNVEKDSSLYVYYLDFNKPSISDIKNLVDTSVNIENNWNNTGRTRIEIIGKLKKPLYIQCSGTSTYYYLRFNYNYNFNISYDSFLEHGNVWLNSDFVDKLDIQKNLSLSGTKTDDLDIDEDGDITDNLAYSTAQTTITSVVSTHQDVTKYVKTDKSTYSTGTVESSYDSEYEYKLRVRTGQNDVTNLVIYDSIEEYTQDKDGNIVTAYGEKKHWNGEFLGIDTSYAESKGYVVKPYYSENVLAGNLYNDDGTLNTDWKEFLKKINTEPTTITSPNWPSNYNNSMTEANDYWEVSYPGAEALEITFDSTCKLESATYDYLRFYDKEGNNITSSVCGITADKIGGSNMAGKTYTIPGDYVKITMRTDSSGVYKGFSAEITPRISDTYIPTDYSKVKSLAFEYLDADGNAAVLPANSLTYVLIKMKSPDDENITSLAYNGCRTQWQALDSWDRPVDFITGINSNIVKVSLPNSVEDKIVNLSFKKIIDATDEDFEKLKLDKDAAYNFLISLTNQETGDVINGLLDSKEGFRVTNITTGTYIIKEEDDIWFNFVSMGLSEPIEGIDFQEVDGEYTLTINATVESDAAIEIDITNKPDEERFYDSKYDIKNLFNLTK